MDDVRLLFSVNIANHAGAMAAAGHLNRVLTDSIGRQLNAGIDTVKNPLMHDICCIYSLKQKPLPRIKKALKGNQSSIVSCTKKSEILLYQVQELCRNKTSNYLGGGFFASATSDHNISLRPHLHITSALLLCCKSSHAQWIIHILIRLAVYCSFW